MNDLANIFDILDEVGEIRPLKIGFINDSFIVGSKYLDGNWYFLQKINHKIFQNIYGLQQNIYIVTNHLRAKLKLAGENDIDRKVLRLIPTRSGELFHKDSKGEYWRLFALVRDTHSYDSITSALAYKAGIAFGNFQRLLADVPEGQLIETIPNFHNMEFRLEQFKDAVQKNRVDRLSEVQWLVDEIESRAEEMCLPERLFREGILPKRINHCDTKVNNLLFDENDNPICIVDLDTVMPGFVMSDFGDFMRTAGNTGEEDDTNLENVSFNMEIFESYSKGYLQEAKTFLTPIEIELLPFGARLLTYMQLCRFLSDYLNGDTYYKITNPLHNLQRSKAQFKLLQSIELNFDEMKRFIMNQI
jgi:Ser/Thr protein kinase RdoA (MazF antagonist)